MNIAFLSSLDPLNIHSWSGTLYFIYKSLQRRHNLTWIGGSLCKEMFEYHMQINSVKKVPFEPEDYTKTFGIILSCELKKSCYDLIICRDYFFLANLVTNTPIIYIGDTTFWLFKDYLGLNDQKIIRRNDKIESQAIKRATYLVYPSEWAKESAIKHYGKDAERIEVIEFGANIEGISKKRTTKRPNICNLLFIGTNWLMKGGDTVLKIHRNLRELGINSHLTIVGSEPIEIINDENVKCYPHIDKCSIKGRQLFHKLFCNSDFLIAPTLYDCFGIVNCEAAAYGKPVLSINIGGVGQIIKDGENGFLFQPNSPVCDWVHKICFLLDNPQLYERMSKFARKEYEKRLNWESWAKSMENLFNKIIISTDVYISTYVINVKNKKERKEHILSEFRGRKEFDLHLVEELIDMNEKITHWNSIVDIIKKAKADEEQAIIICEDNHSFTKSYSPKLLVTEIQKAHQLGADILIGSGAYSGAIKKYFRLYQIDSFRHSKFYVIYSSLFDKILRYNFMEKDAIDVVLSTLALRKMVIYPFISKQKSLVYSDVT